MSEEMIAKVAGEDQTVTPREESAEMAITDDREYIEAYMKICRLYHEKARRITGERPEEHPVAGSAKRTAIDINRNIAALRQDFNRRLKVSLYAEKKFLAEEMLVDLGVPETGPAKDMLMYFLFMEFSEAKEKALSVQDMAAIFDLEGTVYGKIKTAALIMQGQLIKKRFLLPIVNRACTGPAVRIYFLAEKIMKRFANFVTFGPEWKESPEEKPCPEEDSESVKRPSVGDLRPPAYALEDVVLPPERMEELMFFIEPLRDGSLASIEAFGKVKKGKGTVFLFYGPPGTGKSILADAVASFVGKKLFAVDFAKVMERWVGETDKNISSIFKDGRDSGAVVLIDEADGILCNRAYATQDHDLRFVNDMLMEIEKFEGILILTSNHETALDPALERRVAFKMRFELPVKEEREKIWAVHLPETGREGEFDLDRLAAEYEFAGGNIKNAVLNAARRAAREKRKFLTMEDVLWGAEMERKGMYSKKKARTIEGFRGEVN